MPSRKNRFYTENPYYTLFIRPTLTADGDDEPEDSDEPDDNEDSDDEGCYIDENGQVICRTEKSPPSPQPRQPWPNDEEDPSSEPFPKPEQKPEDKFIQALATAMVDFFMPKPKVLQDFTPIQLPQRGPIQPLPVELSPSRAIPAVQPSYKVQQKAQETLEKIRNVYQDRLEQSLKRNQEAAKGRPDLVRDLADNFRQKTVSYPSSSISEVPTDYQPNLNPDSQLALQQLLSPTSNVSPMLIAEAQPLRDYRQFAQRPVSTADYLRGLQAREFAKQQAEAQQKLVQEQIQLAQAQRKAIQLKQWTAQRQAQQQKVKSSVPTLQPDKKTYLNRRQKLLNSLFGGKVFDQTDMQFPYEIRNGQKVEDRNIQQMAAVADWILFKQKTDGQWSDHKVKMLEESLNLNDRDMVPPKTRRQLDIARLLNEILKNNEENNFQRDDARAFAEGMKVLIDANTHNGKVDINQFIADIQLFTIDSAKYEAGRLAGQAEDSNAAYNLFAGPRIGTIGWKRKYWDHDQQYSTESGNPKLVNQVHHFTFFFTKGLLAGSDAAVWVKHRSAEVIDLDNKPDRALGKKAIDLGSQVRDGRIEWKDLPRIIYQELKE